MALDKALQPCSTIKVADVGANTTFNNGTLLVAHCATILVEEVAGGVLVAVTGAGGGPPQAVALLAIERTEDDGDWLFPGGASKVEPKAGIHGHVSAVHVLTEPAVVAGHPHSHAPVIMCTATMLQLHSAATLSHDQSFSLNQLGLDGRGGVTGISITCGCPQSWPVAAMAAAGLSFWIFVAFAADGPVMLQIPESCESAQSIAILRQVHTSE
eukprot:1660474-Amphidinium_carterae.1